MGLRRWLESRIRLSHRCNNHCEPGTTTNIQNSLFRHNKRRTFRHNISIYVYLYKSYKREVGSAAHTTHFSGLHKHNWSAFSQRRIQLHTPRIKTTRVYCFKYGLCPYPCHLPSPALCTDSWLCSIDDEEDVLSGLHSVSGKKSVSSVQGLLIVFELKCQSHNACQPAEPLK